MSNVDEDLQQLELPLSGERLPPQAASRRNAENVQRANAALRAAQVRKEQKVTEARSAVRAVKRRARLDDLQARG